MKEKVTRIPAIPLIVCDPYFSIWSQEDYLYSGPTRHWTGAEHPLSGYVRIDGTTYRFLGRQVQGIPFIPQQEVKVFPTRTIFRFANERIELSLTFLTPCLPNDLDLFSWPLTYIYWSVRSVDSLAHDVSLYFDAASDIAVHSWEQKVVWSRYRLSNLDVLQVGSLSQPVLEKCGDFQRIDWGYLYLAVPRDCLAETCLTSALQGLTQFIHKGSLPVSDDLRMPRQVRLHKKSWEDSPVLACCLSLGSVDKNPKNARIMIAYDDLFSIEYMERRMKPFWRKEERTIGTLLEEAHVRFTEIVDRCEHFDLQVQDELFAAGGMEYATIGMLAFRQTCGAQKLVRDFDGTPYHFSKENTSNGCIATVDVTYPTAPFALVYNPELLRAELTPVLQYASSERWPHSFAPHDLGTYPLANGQVYRGGVYTKEQMPVEECGNMLILISALTFLDKNVDYPRKFWETLILWANYLKEFGYSPDNQLCTDDFAGPLARNTNLSLKAIIALESFSRVCKMAGEFEVATIYSRAAHDMANRWLEEADDGDHFMLAFGAAGTWSLKYNLIWDRILGLNLFPKHVIQKELMFYKKQMNRYGCPLDNRMDYTKLDWEFWVASLYDSKEDFINFIKPIFRFIHDTPDRVPLCDWYYTTEPRCERFHARSVVGGVFIRLLESRFQVLKDPMM